jgi:hypothetical protein
VPADRLRDLLIDADPTRLGRHAVDLKREIAFPFPVRMSKGGHVGDQLAAQQRVAIVVHGIQQLAPLRSREAHLRGRRADAGRLADDLTHTRPTKAGDLPRPREDLFDLTGGLLPHVAGEDEACGALLRGAPPFRRPAMIRPAVHGRDRFLATGAGIGMRVEIEARPAFVAADGEPMIARSVRIAQQGIETHNARERSIERATAKESW